MTTREQSGLQPHPRATANPNWGLGFSLVLVAAVVAAYLITAPPGLAPGANFRERVQRDDLAALNPAPALVFNWLTGSPTIAMPTQPVNWLTGSPTIVMPTQPVNWLTGAPSTDLPTEAWDASHYPNGLDK